MGASRRDAITGMALEIEAVLRGHFDTRTYSFQLAHESVSDLVGSVGEMPIGLTSDILVYHMSFGAPALTSLIQSRPEKLVVVYHNITPSGYFVDVNDPFAMGLQWGRYELDLLAHRAALAVADSDYNARELVAAGYRNVVVDAVGVDPHRLVGEELDIELLREVEEWSPAGFVLFVSQLLPHKRPDLAIAAVHLLRTRFEIDVGLVMVGPNQMTDFSKSVSYFIESLPGMKVLQLGSVGERQLATLYRTCHCYLNTSDHEGLAIPPLEAMACGGPVVVRDRGAMGDTVASGGLVVDGEVGPSGLAAALARVISDEDLAATLRSAGLERARMFSATESSRRFANLILEIA